MRRSYIVTTLFLVMSSLIAGNASSQADAPPLLQLVDQDVGICVQIDNFTRHWRAFETTSLYQRLIGSKLYQRWQQSQNYQQMTKTISEIEKLTGNTLTDILDELLGQSVLLAIYPVTHAEPAAILLTHTKPGSSLNAILSAWEQDKKNSIEQRRYHGHQYTRNEQHDNEGDVKSTVYYFSVPGLFALTEQEELLQKVIDRWKGNAHSLDRSQNYQLAMQSLPAKSFVKIYINPRRWDASLKPDDQTDSGEKALIAAWHHLNQISAAIQIENGLQTEIITRYTITSAAEELKASWKKLSQPGSATLPIPPHAFGSIKGKHDLSGLVNTIVARLDEHAAKKWASIQASARGILMGWDLQNELLPALSPNWAMLIVPRTDSPAEELLVNVVAALEIDETISEPIARQKSKPTAQAALDNAIQFGLNMLVTSINLVGKTGPCELKIKETEQGRLRWVQGLPYVSPAAAIFGNQILFGSHPDAILLQTQSQKPNQGKSVLHNLSQSHFPQAGHSISLNLKQIREFMKANKDTLIDQTSRTRPHAKPEIEKRLTNLYYLLMMADLAYAAANVSETETRISMGLLTEPQAKK